MKFSIKPITDEEETELLKKVVKEKGIDLSKYKKLFSDDNHQGVRLSSSTKSVINFEKLKECAEELDIVIVTSAQKADRPIREE